MSTVSDFVAAGWKRHAEQPQAVADGLMARAPTLDAEADAAGAIGLAEHVWLSHLQNPAGLRAFLQALPSQQNEAGAAIVERARWALATLAGEAPPGIPDGARWCALQNVWSVRVAAGAAAAVRAELAAERAQALAHGDPGARKRLAITTHNLALDLRQGRRGDALRDALMLALADASRELWATSGTWVNIERGDYELARCHAALGDGAAALRHARACLALIEQHAGAPEADAFETFFAHEALAWAQRAAGDTAALAAERARMRQLMDEVTDTSLKPWCEQALAALDPAG